MHKPAAPDIDELARFRAEWRAEVQARRAGHAEQSEPAVPLSAPKAQLPVAGASRPTPKGIVSGFPNAPLSSRQHAALAIYRTAVEQERLGELDEAVRLYRMAFQKDTDVDRLYHREELALSATRPRQPTDSTTRAPPNADAPLPQAVLPVHPTHTIPLLDVISGFPDNFAFEPENETEPVHINVLPDEMLVKILSLLDPTTLERFASISRKARIFTLERSLWRELVLKTYKPPQLTQATLDAAVEQSLYDYRRVFIEQPRVRTDGLYISVCHYIRPGLSENQWVNVNHLIVYHRYLRFYPNGHFIHLRTHEEPATAIPFVNSKSRMQGLFFGRWMLEGTQVYITNLVEAIDSHVPISLEDDLGDILLANPDLVRYVFTMTLSLKSKPLGRWNRLDFTAFDSMQLRSGESLPVLAKHERPFWFSKIRSYH
ncbi:hypothetical protein CYLTODRAFT_427053 [Cylindrobasidium torrendii FP15055 ss-10]|uniref:F-box domain-containing protein n=1 Tax=Cylindrobasidium torrendii FP15055 ss-10 TaxID=1314674 RepID=A0A0D7AWN7_9AGAR|nr:hypothetical protein CYLTODRAFT_427053 [Cylindrobasidium torrendii FP15055 ss-10]